MKGIMFNVLEDFLAGVPDLSPRDALACSTPFIFFKAYPAEQFQQKFHAACMRLSRKPDDLWFDLGRHALVYVANRFPDLTLAFVDPLDYLRGMPRFLEHDMAVVFGEALLPGVTVQTEDRTVMLQMPVSDEFAAFIEGVLAGYRDFFGLNFSVCPGPAQPDAVCFQIQVEAMDRLDGEDGDAGMGASRQKIHYLERLLALKNREYCRANQNYQRSNFFAHKIIEQISEAVVLVNENGKVFNANQGACRLLGYEERELIGRTMDTILVLPQPKQGRALFEYLGEMAGGKMEVRFQCREGRSVKVFLSVSILTLPAWQTLPETDPRGLEEWGSAALCIAENISDRLEVFEQVWNLAKFPNEDPNPVMRISLDGKLIFANKASAPLLKKWRVSVNDELQEDIKEMIRETKRHSANKEFELKCDDSIYSLLLTHIQGENYVNLYGADITRRKKAEAQLIHDAFYDSLTHLPNRALFMDRLTQVMRAQKRPKSYLFAVLFLDVDRFKVINDSLGHLTGDKLLVAVADRLRRCVRPEDTLARLGGDEFTILLDKIRSEKTAILIANRILADLKHPFQIDHHEIFISTSIGIALSSSGYSAPEDLLRDSDTAMYAAKTKGKAQYVIFDRHMHEHMLNILKIENQLRKSIFDDEFSLYYQPKIDLKTRGVAGFEALIRWIPDKGRIISPDKFIPIAEETGQIIPLGEWIIRTACQQVVQWRAGGVGEVPVAVNCSVKQFQQHDFIHQVEDIFGALDLPKHLIQFEITESTLMEDREIMVHKLSELSRMGHQISIDDFGTGYSSLRYLKTFPLDTLKIDKSFIDDVLENDKDAGITSTIVALAHNLDLKVVAEGVETEAQVAFLENLHCDQVQGYYFSKPLKAEEVPAFIQRHGLVSAASSAS